MQRADRKRMEDSRSLLDRDALAHPSFAHVGREELLDHVSSGLAAASRALPFDAPDVDFRAHVFSYLAVLFGSNCCLCGDVRPYRQMWHFRTCHAYCKWLCGDFDGSSLSGSQTFPLCPACNCKVLIFSAQHNGTGMGGAALPALTGELQFISVLHLTATDRSFRKRVEANAEHWATLRFDPRVTHSDRTATVIGARLRRRRAAQDDPKPLS